MSTAQAPVFKMRLERDNSGQPWGFRLQGGADFSTPLSIQKVGHRSSFFLKYRFQLNSI